MVSESWLAEKYAKLVRRDRRLSGDRLAFSFAAVLQKGPEVRLESAADAEDLDFLRRGARIFGLKGKGKIVRAAEESEKYLRESQFHSLWDALRENAEGLHPHPYRAVIRANSGGKTTAEYVIESGRKPELVRKISRYPHFPEPVFPARSVEFRVRFELLKRKVKSSAKK